MTDMDSFETRREYGQSRRKQLPRQSHGRWDPKQRQHSALSLLEQSMRGRVPSLVTLKYERMAASPFGFFRGAVPIMAADLAQLPDTGILTQLCGDAHVRNLGAYAGPDGRLVFDINDFDETIRGPFEWDIKRLATSLVLAGREAGNKNHDCSDAVSAFIRTYCKAVRGFANMPVIDLARYQVHRLQRIAPVSQALLKAERSTALHTLETLTEPAKPKRNESPHRIFKEQKPLLTRVRPSQARAVLASLKLYEESLQPDRRHFVHQYRPRDVAFKVVGTGSVGTRDYCVYFEGNGSGDPLFLQIKEELPSAYEPYLKETGVARHQGRRVAEGQRAMQFQSDIFLGWTTLADRDYVVRQLNDHKASIAVEDLKGQALVEYAEICGELLARGHSRAGEPQVLSGYLGNGRSFEKAIMEFAEAYADQTERDREELLKSKHAPRATAKAKATAEK
ncbi:MAG TPA: DUF2252 domain-containing protein [Acidisarcina sp.]|nr:DUF2252 domain-containing protein [Acidisarcina sp.]